MIRRDRRDHMTRPQGRRSASRWLLLVLGLALLAGHVLVIGYASSRLALPVAVFVGVLVLLVVRHLGLGGVFRALWRRDLRG